MNRSGMARRLGLMLMLVGVTAVWGWTFKVVQDAIDVYGVLPFLAVRFTIAALILAPLSLARMRRRTLKIGLVIGLVLGVSYFFQTLGLKYTSPTNSGLVTGLFVIFAPCFDRMLYGTRLRKLHWLAVGVSLGGMALLTGFSPGEMRTGDAMTIVCAAGFGLHISLLSRHSRRHHPGALAAVQVAVVAVAAWLAWPVAGALGSSLAPAPAWPTADVWWRLAITGVLASGLAFYVQTFVQRRLSAMRTGIILTMEPLFAAMFGYLLAGDRLVAIQYVGAAVLFGAILTSEVVSVTRKTPAGDGISLPAELH